MKRITNPFTLLMLFSILTISCVKQKHYPGDSMTGANVFGIMIYGKKVLPCVSLFSLAKALRTSAIQYPGTRWSLDISMTNNCDKNYQGRYVYVSLDSLDLQGNMTYKLGNAFSNLTGQATCEYWENSKMFGSDSTLPGTILITRFDPINRIVSASFEGVLKERDGNQTIQFTSGKFDVKY